MYHSIFVGSYGRDTAIGVSDLDVIFILPDQIYVTYSNYKYNGQSSLLQSVKNSIRITYPNTDIGGDGQVVVVWFSDGMKFEVVPAFGNKDGSFTYPDSNDGGKWKVTNPRPEIRAIKAYKRAQKALKVDEQLTFSDKEIDNFLPKNLQLTKD